MDDSLSAQEREKFDARLAKSAALQKTLSEFTQLSDSLADIPCQSAPRNFTLTSVEAQTLRPKRSLYPSFSYAGLTILLLAALMFTSEFIFHNFSIPLNFASEAVLLSEAPSAAKNAEDDAQGLLFTWGGGAYGIGGGGEAVGLAPFATGLGSGGMSIYPSQEDAPKLSMAEEEALPKERTMEEDSAKVPVAALILGLREDQAGEVLAVYPSEEVLVAKQADYEGQEESDLIHPYLKFGLLGLSATLLLIALILFLKR